jgi:hypothetical protein
MTLEVTVSYTEQLIEALSESEQTHTEWWESFDLLEEALAVVSCAILERPEESEIIQVLAFTDENGIFTDNITTGYMQCLSKMKRQVKRKMNEDKNKHGSKEVQTGH